MSGRIYLIRNLVNGKGYVGQTRSSLKVRIQAHLQRTIRGSDLPIHSAIRKYGLENFTVLEVVSCEDLNHLNELERHYIRFFGTFMDKGHGYNLTSGGDVPVEISSIVRLKMSVAKKGKSPWNKGKVDPNRKIRVKVKRTFSEETRKKIGQANSLKLKGKPWSDARRNAQRKRV
jgi:group I intron endonuclease